MKKILKIGNAQAFWGDSPQAPARLMQQQPDLDFLTLDYLAEVSLSIMAIQREKSPELGYAADFVDVIKSLIPIWKSGSQVKIVTNAGGLNPKSCARACRELLQKENIAKKIGIIYGDDVLPLIKADPGNLCFNHLDTQEEIKPYLDRLVTANAYMGAKPIVEALDQGADIVITGRVADPSLTVGPCVHYYRWKWNDYQRLASATIAGHLIECGTQVTGGVSTNWLDMPDPANLGFPFVEVSEEGSFVITKPENTGGLVSEETVKEQLLYEIGDPDRYLSPDVTVSFLSLKLDHEGHSRIRISGAKGSPPPNTLKVSATYRAGYKSAGMLTVFGPEAVQKAELCGKIILEKVQQAGYKLERTCIEALGSMAAIPNVFIKDTELQECVLRVAVSDPNKEAVEFFTKEVAPLVTSGPQGVTGYTFGRPHVRQVFAYWPCLIEADRIKPIVEVL